MGRLPTPLVLATAVGSGGLVALQQRINAALGTSSRDATLAALVSFLTGLVAVAAVVLARPRARTAVQRVTTVPWWCRLGGLGGASLVAVGATAAPRLGVALLSVGLVAGQTSGAVVVDRVGLGPGGRHPLSGRRLLGAVVCLAAVGLAAGQHVVRSASPLLVLLVLGAGLLISFQQAVNGRVRTATGDASVATLVNFSVGTALLVAIVVAHRLLVRTPVPHWPGWSQWYLYAGGPIGASFVALAAVVVRRVGVLRLGLATTAGQLAGGVLIDELWPGAVGGVTALTLLGVALTFVAVLVSA